jgi:hypothetical protein
MSTTIQIILWSLLFIGVRLLGSKISVRDLNETEEKKVSSMLFWVRLARLISVATLILFASPYHLVAVENLGWKTFLIAMCIVIIPLRLWKRACIDTLKE